MFNALSFRLRSRGYNPEPVKPMSPEPEPIALKYRRLLERRDVVDSRITAIDQQIEWCHREIRRLETCRHVAGQCRDQINADIKAVKLW